MTARQLTDNYRKSTENDIGWGKTVYLVGQQTDRTVTLIEMKIEKLNLTQCPPKVGMNAFQGDEYRDKVNEERLREMKAIAGKGLYYVKLTKTE